MKKSLYVLLAFVILVMPFATAVSAANFVPSIGYKDAPELLDDKDGCVIVTSVKAAETTELIPEDVAALLLEKYEEIAKDDFDLSALSEELNKLVGKTLGDQYNADSLVIRDFFDIYSTCEDMNEYLDVDGQTITLDFKVDTNDKPIFALVYVDGKWELVDIKDNDNGTVSVTFEEFCPVAFLVPADGYENTPQTGDTTDNTVWFVLMFSSLALIVVLLAYNQRNAKKAKAN